MVSSLLVGIRIFNIRDLRLTFCRFGLLRGFPAAGFLLQGGDDGGALLCRQLVEELRGADRAQEFLALVGHAGFTFFVLEGEAGDLVSLIPLSDCAGVTTFGLKWRLQGSTLKVGTSRGISNVLIGKSCRISLKKGRLLVIKTEPLG